MSNILLIFSDHQRRVKIRSALEDAQCKVSDCLTPNQGLQMFRQERPSIVLVQENPGLYKIEELIQQIKKISPEQPIVVFLENHSMKRALELMNAGAFDCVEPSFQSEELIAIVRRASVRFDASVGPLPGKDARPGRISWLWAGAALLLILAGSAGFYFVSFRADKKSKTAAENLNEEMSFTLPYPHPSGIAFSDESVWICDWYTQSIYQHKRDASLELVSVRHFSDLNPVALAGHNVVLWAVSTNGKILKHALDEKLTVLSSVKSPGPTPSGITHDGNFVWTADSGVKRIYKHLPDEKLTVLAEFLYPGEMPVGLFWDGSYLWSVDGARKALLRHRVDGNRLLIDEVRQFAQYRDPDFKLTGAAFDGKGYWTVAESPSRVIRHALETQ